MIDPVDDYLDGKYQNNDTSAASVIEKNDKKTVTITKKNKKKKCCIPICTGHQRPCKELVVKKAGPNKGRKFYVCSFPRGEQCNFFEWKDNSIHTAKEALSKTYSGFVTRQVSNFTERFRVLTVPELREEAKKRGLSHKGKKQELLMRLSLHVREELVAANGNKDNTDNEGERGEDDSNKTKESNSTGNEFITLTDDEDEEEEEDEDDDDDSTSSIELEIGEKGDDNVGNMKETNNHGDSNDSEETNKSIIIAEKSSNYQENKQPAENYIQEEEATSEQTLKNLFGHTSFRDGQAWAIDRCLTNQRSLLVAPTGFGKSLCYALPAAIKTGVCIVISPLLSLIEDQLRQLPPRIPAATLSGGMSASAMACAIDDILKQRIKILFVSPERLTAPSFRRLFRPRWDPEQQRRIRPFPPVSLLCIDEAHCMSQWAHNFRPSYMRIRILLDDIQPRSVLAITATAGPLIAKDICHDLGISQENDGVKILPSGRDNIDVHCRIMNSPESRLYFVQQLLTKHPTSKNPNRKDNKDLLHNGCLADDTVIIYVWRQRDAEVVGEALSAAGVEGGIVVYHGGMDSSARSKAQSSFFRGKARICVATVAFGMGINKDDIDTVIHMNLPSSPEHYLQEIGRAGRDGRNAKAIALPLDDEIVYRHSLSHSDFICQSQIRALCSMIQSQVATVRNEIIENNTSEGIIIHRAYVAIPVKSAVEALDCKLETIETLLALMERDNMAGSTLRFEGRACDTATIILKSDRLTLERLVENGEPLANCILKCGRKIEFDEEEMNSNKAIKNVMRRSNPEGIYQFSIARCVNLLGPTAEPRHVYATLRRLQNSGIIELIMDYNNHQALQLQLFPTGSGVFNFLSQDNNSTKNNSLLVELLYNQFTEQVIGNANKIKTIDTILRKVSSVDEDNTNDGNDNGERIEKKSERLILFQNLIHAELSSRKANNDSVRTDHDDDKNMQSIPSSSRKELLYDAQSLIHNLRDKIMMIAPDTEKDNVVRFDERPFLDYTALTVSKFLHGIDTLRTVAIFGASYKNTHPLFAKWRQYDFESVRKHVEQSLMQEE